jgi:hypothetical protein
MVRVCPPVSKDQARLLIRQELLRNPRKMVTVSLHKRVASMMKERGWLDERLNPTSAAKPYLAPGILPHSVLVWVGDTSDVRVQKISPDPDEPDVVNVDFEVEVTLNRFGIELSARQFEARSAQLEFSDGRWEVITELSLENSGMLLL